jgi:hypothetical protein
MLMTGGKRVAAGNLVQSKAGRQAGMRLELGYDRKTTQRKAGRYAVGAWI